MGVVLGDDDAGDAFGAGVAVDDIVCNAFQPPLAYIHAHLVGFDIEKVKKKKKTYPAPPHSASAQALSAPPPSC